MDLLREQNNLKIVLFSCQLLREAPKMDVQRWLKPVFKSLSEFGQLTHFCNPGRYLLIEKIQDQDDDAVQA